MAWPTCSEVFIKRDNRFRAWPAGRTTDGRQRLGRRSPVPFKRRHIGSFLDFKSLDGVVCSGRKLGGAPDRPFTGVRPDHRDEICNIRCPVSIVHGRDDQVRKISHAQDLADRLPDATLSLISGGHTVMVENREEWMKELDALLLRVINRKGVNAIGFK